MIFTDKFQFPVLTVKLSQYSEIWPLMALALLTWSLQWAVLVASNPHLVFSTSPTHTVSPIGGAGFLDPNLVFCLSPTHPASPKWVCLFLESWILTLYFPLAPSTWSLQWVVLVVSNPEPGTSTRRDCYGT